jgi:replicative DNA helicase
MKWEHQQEGETHIKIAKHRNGMLETVILKAHLNIQKFEDTTNFPTEEKLMASGARGFEMWKPIGE